MNCSDTSWSTNIAQWQIQDFWKGVSAWQNTSPVWVEDHRKGHRPSYSSLSIFLALLLLNKTTVIGASQSDCSIQESQSDCSIRVYKFQKGFLWKPWNPPDLPLLPMFWLIARVHALIVEHIIMAGLIVEMPFMSFSTYNTV